MYMYECLHEVPTPSKLSQYNLYTQEAYGCVCVY